MASAEPNIRSADADRVPARSRTTWYRRVAAMAASQVARRASIVMLDQGFCSLANFLTGVLVARACTQHEYGLYVVALSVILVFQGIQANLVGIPFTVLLPSQRGRRRRRYFSASVVQHLGFSAVFLVGMLLTALGWRVAGGANDVTLVLLASSGAMCFVILRDFARYVLLAEFRVLTSLVMSMTASLTIIVGLVVSYLFGHLSVPLAFAIVALGSAFPAVCVLVVLRPRLSVGWSALYETLLENFRVGKWLLATFGAYSLANQVYVWILAGTLGMADTASYGAAAMVIAVLNPFVMSVGRFLTPHAAHAAQESTDRLGQVTARSLMLLAPACAVFVVACVFYSETALNFLYNGKYQGVGIVATVLAMHVGCCALISPMLAATTALKRTDLGFKGQMLGAILGLPIGVMLLPTCGPLGAALGRLLSSAIWFAYLGFSTWLLLKPGAAPRMEPTAGLHEPVS